MLADKLKAVGHPRISLVFGEGRYSTTDSTSYTFSDVNIGTANANRYVVVCLAYRLNATTNPDLATVTVAGQSTTAIADVQPNRSTSSVARFPAVLYITDEPVETGTTATIAVTSGGRTFTRCFMATYALTKNGTIVTTELQQSSDNPTSPVSFTVTKPSGHVGIGMLGASTSSTLTGMSVSGQATQDYNSSIFESAGLLTATVTGSGDITFTTTGTSTQPRSIVAVWR
jgi:hypothetical protein